MTIDNGASQDLAKSGLEWRNDIYSQVKILSLIEAVSSGMVEKTGVPGENHRPSASELTNFLTLGSVMRGIRIQVVRGTVISKLTL